MPSLIFIGQILEQCLNDHHGRGLFFSMGWIALHESKELCMVDEYMKFSYYRLSMLVFEF